jgi:capsular polysaccharide biosynthesis protein
MFSIRPITSRAAAKIRQPRPMFEVANEVVELEPGTVWDTEPAICLPNEIERASGFNGPEAMHRSRIPGGPRAEGPTRSYRYDNALISDFTVYANGSYQVYRQGSKRPVLLGRADYFESAQVCTTFNAQIYFGHLFHDTLVLEELAASRELVPLTFTQRPWLHEPGYRTLVERTTIATSLARVDRLWLVDERHLNEGWKTRFGALRDRLRKKVTPSGSHNVFILRGNLSAGRKLANEVDIAERLEQCGFKVLQPEKEKPETIASVLSEARLVVCSEGSAKLHAIMAMPPKATMIEIQPPDAFVSIGKLLCEAIDARWGFVVAERRSSGCYIELERLLRTLDLVR